MAHSGSMPIRVRDGCQCQHRPDQADRAGLTLLGARAGWGGRGEREREAPGKSLTSVSREGQKRQVRLLATRWPELVTAGQAVES